MSIRLDTTLLSDKFKALNTSQQSIETTSSWCIFYKKDSKKVVAAWETEFVRSAWSKRLALLYLANDILQNSRKKGIEFVSEFYKSLPKAVEIVMREGDEKIKKAATRLILIWEERRVFGLTGIKPLKDIVKRYELSGGASRTVQPKTAAAPEDKPSSHPKWHLVERIADTLYDVQQAASNRTEFVQRRDQLPEGWQASNSIDDLSAAIQLLDQCSNSLANEITLRTRAEAILRGLCESQARSLRQAQDLQRQCLQQLEAVRGKVAVLQQQKQPPAMHSFGAPPQMPIPGVAMGGFPGMGGIPGMGAPMPPPSMPHQGYRGNINPMVAQQGVPNMHPYHSPLVHVQLSSSSMPHPGVVAAKVEPATESSGLRTAAGHAVSSSFPPHQAAQMMDVKPSFDELYEPGNESDEDVKDEMEDAFDVEEHTGLGNGSPVAPDRSPVGPQRSPLGSHDSPLGPLGSPLGSHDDTLAGSSPQDMDASLEGAPALDVLLNNVSVPLGANGHLLAAITDVVQQSAVSSAPPVGATSSLPLAPPDTTAKPAPSDAELNTAAALLSQLTEAESAQALLEALQALPQTQNASVPKAALPAVEDVFPPVSNLLSGNLQLQPEVQVGAHVTADDDVYDPEDADL